MKTFTVQFFTWWNGTTLGTRFYTWLRGEFVGEDEFGNRYYQNGRRRWVIYKGAADPSYITAAWHSWMHQRTDTPPTKEQAVARAWQAPHQPNLTGTAFAYRPKGSIATEERRPRATGDYDPWRP